MVIVKNIRQYEIQRRVWEDVHWFKAWYRGMKPKWSEWKLFVKGDDMDRAFRIENILNEQKHKLKYKVEYRLIKNELNT